MTHVIVLADRCGRELRPLTERCPVALLPVAAKALLVHCIEDIGMAGLRDLTLVVSEHADLVRAEIGTGARWGLRIDYLPSRGEERPDELLGRLTLASDRPRLVLRGDVLRAPCLRNFLEALPSAASEPSHLVFADRRVGAIYLPAGVAGTPGVQTLAWNEIAADAAHDMGRQCASDGYHSALEDVAAYHRVNLDAACGRVPGLLLPGRQVAVGLTVGRHSRVSPRSLRQGVALIGSNVRIDSRAKLHGEVVIADDVLVDQEADIQDSVILPNTYIGQLVDIRNAIVFGAEILRVDTGAHLHVNDTFLVADLGRHGNLDYLMRPLNRLAGLVLLALSLPLWPVAAALVLLRNPTQPMKWLCLRGNRIELNEFGIRQRRAFRAVEWNCRPPVLRYLPRLFAVVSGDLRLVGTLPITEAQAVERIEPWQREADRAPAGLIGPSQLLLPGDALEEEIVLSDAVYTGRRSFRQNLSYLALALRTLFTRRAWLG
ncbi:sugar phosphate nucleotidyltransferase [Methylotetracoccus oryzae]|uniref:sugar phosphate nucleotidyltransferase n=1 Tax=Methylotetracoccus oryzae TaxID=1919059 RepID=UPI0011188524|nr:NDP-sugar synthase [Methylotetracoccus oryzae]